MHAHTHTQPQIAASILQPKISSSAVAAAAAAAATKQQSHQDYTAK